MPVKIIYHGHSCLEIHSGEHRIQLDPFYDSNPLADVKSDKPNPQYILLSHAHFDHMDDAEPHCRGAPERPSWPIMKLPNILRRKILRSHT